MERPFDLVLLAALGAFLLLFAGRGVQLRLTTGVNPLQIIRGKPAGEALGELLLVLALPLWLYEAVAAAWPLPGRVFPAALYTVVIDHTAARVLGSLLVVGGVLLFAAALVSFGASWRVGIDRDTPGALVTGGVFALSRNPIFVFLDGIAVGTFLLTGELFFALFAGVTLLAIHQQILREEAFLEERYGAAYAAYRKRTPRYLLA